MDMMNWTTVFDFVFGFGMLLSAGFLLYCGCLSIAACASGSQRARARSPVADFASAAVFAIAILVLPGSVLAGEAFDQGIEAYEDAKYSQAISHFRVAADAGDARAQEILGFVYLLGPTAYGAAIPGDREQAIHWFGRAAQGGREIARHVLCVIPGRPALAAAVEAECIAGRRIAALRAKP